MSKALFGRCVKKAERRPAMSIGEIIFLTLVVGAFVFFMVVLAWGDYHVQQTARRTRDRDQKETAPPPSVVGPARWPQEPVDRLQHAA
jgi:hypothetical protein